MSIELTVYGTTNTPNTLGLGVFDGVHLGHQALLNQCDALLTFNPHPVTIINPSITIERLTTIEEMTHYIKQLYVLTFNDSVANLSAREFLDTIILEKIKPRNIVIGYDYHFGKNKEGTPELFKSWCDEHDIGITIVPPIKNNEAIIKSQAIRQQLKNTQASQALDNLGHSYLMIGTVIHGDNRGKTLGYPTANLVFDQEKLIPHHGVYKGKLCLKNQEFKAMIYIGNRPTFNTNTSTVEAFLLDFEGDLYNQKVHLYLEKFLRDEQKFNDHEALISQINNDINHAFNTP